MKLLPSLALASLLAASSALAQQSVQQMLTEAQTAYMRGELEVARTKFQEVNRQDPRNQVAVGFLRRITADLAKAPKGNSLEKQLAGLNIPQVEFRQATLGAALDFLKQTVTKVSDGKTSVNFVIPDDLAAKGGLTLSLTNVPFTEVLKYVGTVASVDFVYDKYAITVKPRGATAAAPAQ